MSIKTLPKHQMRKNGLGDLVTENVDFSSTLQPVVDSAMYSNLPPLVDTAFSVLPTRDEAYAIGQALGKDVSRKILARPKTTSKTVGSDGNSVRHLRLTEDSYEALLEKIPLSAEVSVGKTNLSLPIRSPIASKLTRDAVNSALAESVDPVIDGAIDALQKELKPKVIWGAVGLSSALLVTGFFVGKWYANRK